MAKWTRLVAANIGLVGGRLGWAGVGSGWGVCTLILLPVQILACPYDYISDGHVGAALFNRHPPLYWTGVYNWATL